MQDTETDDDITRISSAAVTAEDAIRAAIEQHTCKLSLADYQDVLFGLASVIESRQLDYEGWVERTKSISKDTIISPGGNNPTIKLIITVNGGVVDNVYLDGVDNNVIVRILDYDSQDDDDDDVIELEQQISTVREVY